MKKNMKKKILFALTFLCILFGTQRAISQNVYLSDANWRNYLINEGLDLCLIGDSLDITCPVLPIVASISCNGWSINQIEGLEYFTNLISLDCSNNNLTSIPVLPTSLRNLYAGLNQIDTITNLPDSLETLNCNSNLIVSVPTLPSTLTTLKLNSNLVLGTLVLPSGIVNAEFEHNQIDSLGTLPSSLVNLKLGDNNLSVLPLLPANLSYLSCFSNNLVTLPLMPSSLVYLNANTNLIGGIASFGSNLNSIELEQNQLTSLAQVPSTLKTLKIGMNQLASLSPLPDSLTYLSFNDNFVTIIDSLPKQLETLNCMFNQLASLPDCPNSLRFLLASGNNIQTLNAMPSSLDVLSLAFNPINCLPAFDTIGSLEIQLTGIHCLANRFINDSSDVLLADLPLCEPSSGCPIDWSISGRAYFDINQNCIFDSGENILRNIPVHLNSAGATVQICYTNSNGEYFFRAPLGLYTVNIDTNLIPFRMTCLVGGVYTTDLTLSDSIFDIMDFGLSCPSDFDLIANSIHPGEFIPGGNTRVDFSAGDNFMRFGGECFNVSGDVYVITSGNVSYVSPAPGALTPTYISGDTIHWVIGDFPAVNLNSDFNIILQTDPAAVQNDTVCLTLSIPIVGELDSSNNSISNCYYVLSSFGPNEKWVSPEYADTSDYSFTFTINFQNTGSVPAENLYILDTLDDDLDISTFEFISSSHAVVTQLLPGRVLRFNFNSINLPDSASNSTLSRGFVNYRMNRRIGSGVGTVITNTAYIYFDFNAPLVTNTVSSTVSIVAGIDNNILLSEDLSVYPNPTTAELNTVVRKGKIHQISVHDMLGKLVVSQSQQPSVEAKLNLEKLNPGIYIVSVITDKGKIQRILIKN